jgi:hypothetical protein
MTSYNTGPWITRQAIETTNTTNSASWGTTRGTCDLPDFTFGVAMCPTCMRSIAELRANA